MARGNLFQGMAHGALGDVTFQRKNGMQVSSVRVRQQTNPNSTQQCYQRTCFATVVQAYAAGREIFDHSFEGCTTPADNQAKFYSLNVARLKDALINGAAVHSEYNQDDFRFVAPHVSWPVPSTFQISQGSLPSGADDLGITGDGNIAFRINPKYFVGTQTLADFVNVWPYDENILFTVCTFAIDTIAGPVFTVPANITPEDETHCNNQYRCYFSFLRLRRKPLEELDLTKRIARTYWKDVFLLECSADYAILKELVGNHLLNTEIYFDDFNKIQSLGGSWGVILSHVNDGRRSDCDMKMVYNPNINFRKNFGLSGGYIADAWRTDAPSIATP